MNILQINGELSRKQAAMAKKPGFRHTILFIPHSMNRIWRTLMLLDVVIWVTWWFAPYGARVFTPPNDRYLLLAGTFILVLILFFFMIRNWGYVQAHTTYVKVVVPFYQLNIPYKYIEGVRMTEFRRLFDYSEMSWVDKRFLRPYFRETVATLHLKKFPKSYTVLKFFLPNYLFIPHEVGFLFLIKNYLMFNTEVDSRLVAYRDRAHAKATKTKAFIFDEE
jgi:hypothetical protein